MFSALYTFTDLGDVPGGDDRSEAFDINNAGEIVGTSGGADGYHAFIWSAGAGMTDLGDWPGQWRGWNREVAARAINSAGVVIGTSSLSVSPVVDDRAFSWTRAAGFQDLSGTPIGEAWDFAADINDRGQIVGVRGTRAVLWNPGTSTQELGTLPGGDGFSTAEAINTTGLVVGQSDSSVGLRPYLWTPGSGMQSLGDIDAVPGGRLGSDHPDYGYGFATDINDNGVVVGMSTNREDHERAFRWTAEGGMQDLGALLSGNLSSASSINNEGAVVGRSLSYSGWHAFVWTSSDGMRDLNSLIPADTGWILENASAINDIGQIVGLARTGTPNYRYHAFLLTPIARPAPPAGVQASDGAFPDRVHITWNPAAGADSYEIWRNTTNDASSATLISAGLTGTSYDDTSAAPGTTYYYWVTARNSGGVSDFSAADPGSALRRIDAPPAIAAVLATPNPVTQGSTFRLCAQKVTDDRSVSQVYFYRDGNGDGAWDPTDPRVATGTRSGNDWISADQSTKTVAPGTYYYFARAEDGGGQWSDPVTVSVTVRPRTLPPVAHLVNPLNGSLSSAKDLNGRRYIDVWFGESTGLGLDEQSILDAAPELKLSGTAAQGVKLRSGAPMALGHSTYRYSIDGSFRPGTVIVNYLSGTWADRAGGINAAAVEQFTLGEASIDGLADRPADHARTPVQIQRFGGGIIDPDLPTWVVIHGRQSWSGADNIQHLASAIEAYAETDHSPGAPRAQVLLLDWKSGAKAVDTLTTYDFTGEDWIKPVATVAADALKRYGLDPSRLNLVGHSWGSYVADEMAERLGRVNTIIALDPAKGVRDIQKIQIPIPTPTGLTVNITITLDGGKDYNPDDGGQINFGAHSRFSWAFRSSFYGSALTPKTATEAFAADVGSFFSIGSHTRILDLFSTMLDNNNRATGDAVSSLFTLTALLTHSSGPWAPNQYKSNLADDRIYEGMIDGDSTGTKPQRLRYILRGSKPRKELIVSGIVA